MGESNETQGFETELSRDVRDGKNSKEMVRQREL